MGNCSCLMYEKSADEEKNLRLQEKIDEEEDKDKASIDKKTTKAAQSERAIEQLEIQRNNSGISEEVSESITIVL